MFFSVIVPLYNKVYSIQRCINSILNQSYKNLEIIIVNDGSTDNSVELVKKIYQEQLNNNLINIIEQTNQGVSIARNVGVKNSKYEYICFLDADDEWNNEYLSVIANLIKDYPNASLYSVAHRVNRNNGNKIEERFPNLSREFRGYIEDFFQSSISNDIVNSSTACVLKKDFISIGGFPVGVVSGEDYFVWIMLAMKGKIAFENRCLVTLYTEFDPSRIRRKNSVPYPFLYFSKNKKIKLTKSLKKYLFVIFYKHFLMSLIKLRFKEASLRLFYFIKIFIGR